jgi:ubiquinone/menaquinone biosynthesis C-methylase UbiE
MSGTDHWIHKVYSAKSRDELRTHYDQWAEHYDADMLETGYLHYAVMAGLVARHVPDRQAAILDAGVGTGAFGTVLDILGYSNLHGLDMSQAMLTQARSRACYKDLVQAILGEELPLQDQQFAAIVSTGTFTTGHAPVTAFAELARILTPNGLLLITVGTQVWAEAGFDNALRKYFAPQFTTEIYHPMPHSKTESGFTARAHVWVKK